MTAAASQGDQLVNARIMKNAGVSEVVQEADLSEASLRESLAKLTPFRGCT